MSTSKRVVEFLSEAKGGKEESEKTSLFGCDFTSIHICIYIYGVHMHLGLSRYMVHTYIFIRGKLTYSLCLKVDSGPYSLIITNY